MADEHEQKIEEREAYEYWGYLFKADKTGTDRLKGLLRGLKDKMNERQDPNDSRDLTPGQLASFYRDLHGNYDQLFLGTPSESIAFIYKSLGCLHSLQPLSPSTAFTDPTVPALKTEGWIMWQTIQLLLGPDEHSGFLMEAVSMWDVKDAATGEVFPKILPRKCFPMEPDKHMVAWYEGVSERLRREAEDEERQREIEAQQAEVRRLHAKKEDTDDEGSVDSRGPALAYFRNPLYRHVDGRPSIVRRNSKRPALSPRPTMMDKSKDAAATMGHVIRNIGSPHLWDGGHGRGGKSHSHSRDRDRHRRRTSLPDNRYTPDGPPPPPQAGHDTLSPGYGGHHRRRRSAQLDNPPPDQSDDEGWTGNTPPVPSPNHRPRSSDDRDATLRHSRSHEPTPSQKEYPDYFHGYDANTSRRSSAYEGSPQPSATTGPANGFGPSFGPSASPLFASHVAKQPQPHMYPRPRPPPSHGDPYAGSPRPAPNPAVRRAQGRPYSQSPSDHGSRRRGDERSRDRDRDRDPDRDPRRDRRSSRYDTSPPPIRDRDDGPPGFEDGPPPPGQYPLPSRDRRSTGRMSGSDLSYSGPEDRDRRGGPPGGKRARFAEGVDGRRYADGSPWR